MEVDLILKLLKEKYRKILRNQNEFILSYKRNLWKGILDASGNIRMINETGLVHRERTFPKNKFRIEIPYRQYLLLVKNTNAGKAEASGVILGIPIPNGLRVTFFLNFSAELVKKELGKNTPHMKALHGGYGGTLASPEVNAAVGRLAMMHGSKPIGFYHTHPTDDPFTPADLRELQNMRMYPYLREASNMHILCRRSGWIPSDSEKLLLIPRASYRVRGIFFKEVPIVIIK